MLNAKKINDPAALKTWHEELAKLNGEFPLLLLPLRTEARFLSINDWSGSGGGPQPFLWVRVFPDDIAIETHESGLTQEEITAGQNFWTAWADDDNREARIRVWGELVGRLNPNRAVWVKRQLDPRPLNPDLGQRPLQFPDQPRRESGWTQAAFSRVLPDRFVVAGVQNGELTHLSVGMPVPAQLQTSIDPSTANKDEAPLDANGQLIIEEGLRWMTDLTEATFNKGMACYVPLSAAEARTGFDELFVFGVKTADTAAGKDFVEKLFENHRFSRRGFGIVLPGTPTNNTPEMPAGYSTLAGKNDWSYALEFDDLPPAEQPNYGKTDASRLASALGINKETLQRIENQGARSAGAAQLINRVLWHGTIGATMDDFYEQVFTPDNVTRTGDFFANYLVASGQLPTIRAGRQPYGILPVTAFSRLAPAGLEEIWQAEQNNPDAENRAQRRFEIRLAALLRELQQSWTDLQKGNVRNVHQTDTDPSKTFLEMLALQPRSAKYFSRYGSNVSHPDGEFGPFAAQASAMTSTAFFQNLRTGDFRSMPIYTQDNTPTVPNRNAAASLRRSNTTLAHARFYPNRRPLRGPLVHDDPSIADQPLPKLNVTPPKSYLEWLAEATPAQLREVNFLEKQPSGALLFLQLRYALLAAYRRAAIEVLAEDGIFEPVFLRQLGSYGHIAQNTTLGKIHITTWSTAFLPMNELVIAGKKNLKKLDTKTTELVNYLGAHSLAEYLAPDPPKGKNLLFQQSPLQSKTQLKWRSILADLHRDVGALQPFPIEKLEKLLAEHVDLCSYRIDAWMTGLAFQKLDALRKVNPEGIHLGAYGYLENLRPAPPRTPVSNLSPELRIPGSLLFDKAPVTENPLREEFLHAPSIGQATAAAVLRSGYRSSRSQSTLTGRMAVNLSSVRVRRALLVLDGLAAGLSLGALLGQQLERGLHDRFAEAEMDRFIGPLRRAFPLDFPQIQPTDDTKSPVVDGVALMKTLDVPLKNLPANESLDTYLKKSAFANCPAALKNLIFSNATDLPQAEKEKRLRIFLEEVVKLADVFDALGDLALSESVFQIVQGNRVRAAAVLDAMSEGRTIPSPELIRTPRSGTVVMQRVVQNLAPQRDTGHCPPGWDFTAPTLRARCEPSLNHWLAAWLGPANQIFCRGIFKKTTEESPRTEIITAAAFGLQPIDLCYLAAHAPDKGLGELRERFAAAVGAIDMPELNFDFRAADAVPGARSLGEVLTLLGFLGKAALESRALMPRDFTLNGVLPEDALPDLAQARERVVAAAVFLNKVYEDAQALLLDSGAQPGNPASGNFQPASLTEMMRRLSDAGIPDAYPEPGATMTAQAARFLTALNVLESRLAQAAELENAADFIAMDEWSKALLGKDFLLLPIFKPAALANEVIIQLNLPAEKHLLREHFDAKETMREWLQVASDVRKKLHALDLAAMLGEDTMELPAPMPVQFPRKEGDFWAGSTAPNSFWSKNAGRDLLSMVLLNPALTAKTEWTGFVADEWIEVVPATEQTTGVAFYANEPDARPPQSLLLAVPPVARKNWDAEDLFLTLRETFQMAKNRLVEPDHLLQSSIGHLFPGIVAETFLPDGSSDKQADVLRRKALVMFHLENNS